MMRGASTGAGLTKADLANADLANTALANAALSARLVAAGKMIGVPVTVTEGDEWAVEGTELRIGLGFYRSRGYTYEEAIALSLRDMWSSIRMSRLDRPRLLRRRSIERGSPELAPLLAAIDHIQATSDLLAMLPSMRRDLSAATLRGVPTDLTNLPPQHQWVAAILRHTAGPDAQDAPDTQITVGENVRMELDRLLSIGENGEALRRVCAADRTRTQLRRLERALALLMPPYLRLLAADSADRGLSSAGDTALSGEESGSPSDLGVSSPAPDLDNTRDNTHDNTEAPKNTEKPGANGTQTPDGAGTAEDSEDAEREIDDESAHGPIDPSESPRIHSRNTSLTRHILPTAVNATGSLIDALLSTDEAPAFMRDERPEGTGAGLGNGRSAVALSEYRLRLDRYGEEIAQMRDVWRRVIAERHDDRTVISPQPSPDGDTLNLTSLARTIAEAAAGTAKPHAFQRKLRRPKNSRGEGNTDYVVLVDRSGSMSGPYADAAADGAMIMLEALAGAERDIRSAQSMTADAPHLTIRTALVVFAAEPQIVKPLDGELTDDLRLSLHTEVRNSGGSTDDGAALQVAARQLGLYDDNTAGSTLEHNRRQIVILVGDGGSSNPQSTHLELSRLRDAGVQVFGIGIGTDDITLRFAPFGIRLNHPSELPQMIQRLVENTL